MCEVEKYMTTTSYPLKIPTTYLQERWKGNLLYVQDLQAMGQEVPEELQMDIAHLLFVTISQLVRIKNLGDYL